MSSPASDIAAVWRSRIVIVATGCTAAALTHMQIDVLIPNGSLPLRVLIIAAVAMTGLYFSHKAGFRLAPDSKARYLAVLLIAALAAAYCWVLDGLLFRPIEPSYYPALYAKSMLAARLAYFTLRTFNENILYRLLLTSLLAFLLGLRWHTWEGKPAAGAIWTAIIAAQAFNIGINLFMTWSTPLTPVIVLYLTLRFIVPGVIWGWVYWRYGFLANELLAVSFHLFLQPSMGLLF